MEESVNKREKAAEYIGWIGMVIAILMWSSLLDQIRLNLTGHKGSWVFAMAVVINCSLWVAYGILKNPRLWQVSISNAPGVILGIVAVITSF